MKNNRMFLAAFAAVGTMLVSASAIAQDQSTTTTTTVVTVPVVTLANRISVGDEIFLMDLVHANAREIIMSRIAEHMADSHGVADYAHHMVMDHEALQNQLLTTYGSMPWMHHWQTSYGPRMGDHTNNMDNNNNTGDTDHDWDRGGWANWDWNKADVNWRYIYPADWNEIHILSGLNGFAFDKYYMDTMANDHAMILDKLNMHARETQNTDIQSLVTNVSPTVQHHLQEARGMAFMYQDPFDIDRNSPWIH